MSNKRVKVTARQYEAAINHLDKVERLITEAAEGTTRQRSELVKQPLNVLLAGRRLLETFVNQFEASPDVKRTRRNCRPSRMVPIGPIARAYRADGLVDVYQIDLELLIGSTVLNVLDQIDVAAQRHTSIIDHD